MTNTIHLLRDFTAEDIDEYGCRVFAAPDCAGYVTVDYEKRGFRTGIVRHGRMDSTAEYAGKGWRKRLELDAQCYLAGLLAK